MRAEGNALIVTQLRAISCHDSHQVGEWVPQSERCRRVWAELPEFTSRGSAFNDHRAQPHSSAK